MKNAGFKIGRYNPCTFWHPKKDLKVNCHGDVFVSSGSESDFLWLKTEMEKSLEIKTQVVGHGDEHIRECKILNRIVRATEN